MPVVQLDDPTRAALDGAATISLSIARPMPLPEMLRMLVSGTPLSLVLDENVSGTFIGDLKGLTMRQALEAVLFPRSLDYDVQGNLIRVFPQRPRTRLFDVNYLNVRRTWQRGMRSAVNTPGNTAASQSASAVDGGGLDDLERGVHALLSSSGRMHVDRSAGVVQVTDFSDRLEQVGLYVEAVQVRASRQVRLEARVFEVTLRDRASTIDWRAAAARSSGALRMDPGAAGVRVTNFSGLMQALGEQGTVRMIAAPQVVAMNNEPAIISAGSQEVYFVSASQLDADGRTTAHPSGAAAILHGLALTVTAQIASDGIVQLNIAPSYAQKTGQVKSPRGDTAPALSIAEVDTNVRVRDGETIVISGLLRDRTTTTPGTGIGGFFGAQAKETVTSELVILLTPTVVSPGVSSVAERR
jgi:MSHA biogenesis protein MshL